MPMTNHGVSEISNYFMKLRRLVQCFTVNVITRVPLLNSVLNPPTSKMITSPLKSDPLRSHHKAE